MNICTLCLHCARLIKVYHSAPCDAATGRSRYRVIRICKVHCNAFDHKQSTLEVDQFAPR